MTWIEAILLGVLQGFSEFLPVSSSGHLEAAKYLLGIDSGGLLFHLVVHLATMMSTVVVFRKRILRIISVRGSENRRWILCLVVGAVPAGIAGLTLRDWMDSLFKGDIILVGSMLLVTAAAMGATKFIPTKPSRELTPKKALAIGLAQAIALLPGISRSGTTISTALYLNIRRADAAAFSFLLVLIPIAGASALELAHLLTENHPVHVLPLLAGFLSAFFCGLVACRWMVSIVANGTLYWFALYCALAGGAALAIGLWHG